MIEEWKTIINSFVKAEKYTFAEADQLKEAWTKISSGREDFILRQLADGPKAAVLFLSKASVNVRLTLAGKVTKYFRLIFTKND